MACIINDSLIATHAKQDNLLVTSHHKLPNLLKPQLPVAAMQESELLVQDLDFLLQIRGGDDIDIDMDSDSSGVMAKLRNIIRSVLEVGERKVPSLARPLKSLLKALEGVLGVDLLPKAPKKKSKKNKKLSGKKKAKQAEEEDEEEDAESEPTKKEKKAKKPSAATSKHINQKMSTTSPNYRIQKELKAFIKDPPPNLSVKVGKNLRVWIVNMEGAKGSTYEGETFKLRISFPASYPTMPPSVYFLPPNIPKHEHVYTNGDICLSLLGKDWRPTMTAQSIANSILSILSSAQSKSIPMDNAKHAQNKPGQYQQDWVYHDDNC